MFNIEEYYNRAHSGDRLTSQENEELIAYIKSFSRVILWGASYLGKAMGKCLLNHGVKIDYYWDIRAEEIKELNGLKVRKPLPEEIQEKTLLIFCIGNQVIANRLIERLIETNPLISVLRGDFLYCGLLCPFDKKTGVVAKRCSGTMECRQIYCKRLGNIVKKQKESDNPLHLTSVTLVINSKCSLKCKCCTSYMNEYPLEKRTNVPVERICKDIDVFFEAVDTVGTITVMGGEPFMHPQISEIIQHLCSKKNFGLISIATSGTYPITREQLIGLDDKRVNVSFSNYTATISEKQKELFYKNIEFVKEHGVSCTVGLVQPEWIIPSTLYEKERDLKSVKKQKSECVHWPQIKNGKVHPCDLATAIYGLAVADYQDSYVDLTQNISSEMMKKKLQEFLNREYYSACKHHGGKKQMSKGAEQGYQDFLHKEK